LTCNQCRRTGCPIQRTPSANASASKFTTSIGASICTPNVLSASKRRVKKLRGGTAEEHAMAKKRKRRKMKKLDKPPMKKKKRRKAKK
jgi:hypothetical protein